MMRPIAIIVLVVLAIALIVSVFGLPLLYPKPTFDTTTHSYEVAGFYGRGDFAGELLQSDTIVTNVTDEGNMSQSIEFKGAICPRVQGIGRVFLDGSKVTEPDAMYKVYVNGVLQFSVSMELGSSTVLTTCLVLTQKDYVITGQTIGSVKVELMTYVFDFGRGAGAYEVLASDQARLT